MPLPININDLLSGNVIEWDRLEFKEGWNPEEAIQAICAFANDFHNWGGGYLIFGLAERDGKPLLPPKGLTATEADRAQRKLLELGHKIQPNYHPICEPVTIDGKLVLVVWIPGGEMRPYKAPLSLSKKNSEWAYFVRINANTVRAKGEIERELLNLANRIPFDDRQNATARLSDLQPALIEQYLGDIRSDLGAEVSNLGLEGIGRRMQIVRGPSEAPRPLNVGLLFFSHDPSKWFPQTQIDIVTLPEGAGGDQIIEKTFKGPLASMLRSALSYLKNHVVTRYTRKQADQAEAPHYDNVPYAVIEEAVVNAVYHRSYEEREPIEVRITPDELTVLSFPGPDRSVQMDLLRQGKAVARRYRNRRIGEFLKELELSEARCTGIPKILRAMEENGSEPPSFETDEDRSSFLVRIPLRKPPSGATSSGPSGHQGDQDGPKTGQSRAQDEAQEAQDEAQEAQDGAQVKLSVTEVQIIKACIPSPRSGKELLAETGYPQRTGNFKRALDRLLQNRLLERTLPNKPTSRHQKYRTTPAGREAIRVYLETRR
jgi:ATP-dependent DNA helicase RecG